VRWAILRQALRCCGLDPRAAPIVQPRLANNSFAWRARCGVFIRLARDMTFYARRWASRIRELSSRSDDDDDFRIRSRTISNPAATTTIFPRALRADSTTTIFSVAIRGPPQPTPENTSPAPCWFTSEVAGVCGSA
jgi:hypothetical protein